FGTLPILITTRSRPASTSTRSRTALVRSVESWSSSDEDPTRNPESKVQSPKSSRWHDLGHWTLDFGLCRGPKPPRHGEPREPLPPRPFSASPRLCVGDDVVRLLRVPCPCRESGNNHRRTVENSGGRASHWHG